MSWITAPFAWLLRALYDLTGSYGWAVILFGVVVNLILPRPVEPRAASTVKKRSKSRPTCTSSRPGAVFANSASPSAVRRTARSPEEYFTAFESTFPNTRAGRQTGAAEN